LRVAGLTGSNVLPAQACRGRPVVPAVFTNVQARAILRVKDHTAGSTLRTGLMTPGRRSCRVIEGILKVQRPEIKLGLIPVVLSPTLKAEGRTVHSAVTGVHEVQDLLVRSLCVHTAVERSTMWSRSDGQRSRTEGGATNGGREQVPCPCLVSVGQFVGHECLQSL